LKSSLLQVLVFVSNVIETTVIETNVIETIVTISKTTTEHTDSWPQWHDKHFDSFEPAASCIVQHVALAAGEPTVGPGNCKLSNGDR